MENKGNNLLPQFLFNSDPHVKAIHTEIGDELDFYVRCMISTRELAPGPSVMQTACDGVCKCETPKKKNRMANLSIPHVVILFAQLGCLRDKPAEGWKGRQAS